MSSQADFKAFVFGNPYKFYAEANPSFFEGTAVEAKLQVGKQPKPRPQPTAAAAASPTPAE